MTPALRSVNLAAALRADATPRRTFRTGIDKESVGGPVLLRDPGDRATGLGSGVVGDHIGSRKHHGGRDQAVYAVAREELDHWAGVLGREIPDGTFGENLTTEAFDVDAALVGEVWRVGAALLQVTAPRIPCSTFARRMGVRGWVRRFAERGRTGAYLRVLEPGEVRAGDPIVVESRPDHGITVADMFRIVTTERHRLGELRVIDDLHPTAQRDLRRAGL